MMAQALQGDVHTAWESFKGLSPAHRAVHPQRGPVYELEPYVMPGDTYGAAPYVGRGGWSWYTGSAAWLQRAAIETLLGLQVQGSQLRLTPRVPPEWPGFEITLRLHGRELALQWCADDSDVPAGAISVRPGEWIHWQELGDKAVVRLTQVRTSSKVP